MRTIISSMNTNKMYYLLASCSRKSDPTPEASRITRLRARIYDDARIKYLEQLQKLLIREVDETHVVIFVALDAHEAIGGLVSGFHKMMKLQRRIAFVHQSEFQKDRAYWDQQLDWLMRQIREPVVWVERTKKHAHASHIAD
eukprot:m51a1_g733 hypothetical protein (142) ;mRNA; r:482109-482688